MPRNSCQSEFGQEDTLHLYFIHGFLKTVCICPDIFVYDNFLSVGEIHYLEKIKHLHSVLSLILSPQCSLISILI